MTEQDKVTVDDIIGIVKTEEQTNSVEEVRKLRGRENKTAKRFEFREINELPILPKCYDTEKQEYANLFECVDWLNELYGENQNLREILKFLPNDNSEDILNVLNTQQNEIVRLIEENEQLEEAREYYQENFLTMKTERNQFKRENEQLKIALKDKENLINICEKKFKELGYLITCDDDGYVIE